MIFFAEETAESPQYSGDKNFSVGEIVWGPHGNSSSWPGKLIESSSDSAGDEVQICWFGSKEVTLELPTQLKNLSDGLEAHHRERKRLRK